MWWRRGRRKPAVSSNFKNFRIAIRFFTLSRTQNPALGGETFLLIHHPTLNEVRQEWRGAEATIALCHKPESLKRSVLGAHNCALSPFYILMTRYSSQIFFVWDSKRKDGWTYSLFHVQAGRRPLNSYKRLNAKTTNDSFSTGGGPVFKSQIPQCAMYRSKR